MMALTTTLLTTPATAWLMREPTTFAVDVAAGIAARRTHLDVEHVV